MITSGIYRETGASYYIALSHTKRSTEVVIYLDSTVVSAYKNDGTDEFSYNNVIAKRAASRISKGIRSCTAKNSNPSLFELGAMTVHTFVKSKVNYEMMLHNNEVCGAVIKADDYEVNLAYSRDGRIPSNIPYIKLTKVSKQISESEDELEAVKVRTVEEIALEKEDITWFSNKKYYTIQDEETAENIFSFLDNYKGRIAYDIESTGLKMNCFGKIGSKYMADLEKYNEEHKDEQIRADRLCGIIFCVEDNVSYYFPCFSRKYKVLYQDRNSEYRKRYINNIRSRYTIGDRRDNVGDMARYIRETPDDEIREDVILMERVRDILEKNRIETHGGSIEWKTGYMYDIDTNIVDDSMILHQLLYKFKVNPNGKPEASNLKFLSKKYLGIDQWSLKDFFPNITEDEDDNGTVRGKKRRGKAKSKIDFSYMDLQGTNVYAPTDGDCTRQLVTMFKRTLLTEYTELKYLYGIEMIVLCAIGYMEFYGHVIDEGKILSARDETTAKKALIESEIRQAVNYASEDEIIAYNKLVSIVDESKAIDDRHSEEEKRLNNLLSSGEGTDSVKEELRREEEEYTAKHKDIDARMVEVAGELEASIAKNEENKLNLGSPAQVGDLFYNKLGYPDKEGKGSVAKKSLKPLLSAKNEDGTNKYKVVHLYKEYKSSETLLQKFFDNLPDFMYPGGYIFSSYGQIMAATGRMTCSKPNAQQYPKVITKIVVPRKGYVFCDADFSQIEYRVLTFFSGNKYLLKLFSDPDSDYHTLMASLMYGVPYASVTATMRSAAKSFNFGIPYGMGPGSLAILLKGVNNAETRAEAIEKTKMYFAPQPETKKFFDTTKERASVNKYTRTYWGRRRWYEFIGPDGKVNDAKKAASLRQAGNAVIQGTAADIFKISVARNFMYIRQNKLFGDMLISNMIHDEQLIEINAQKLNVERVVGDIGRNMQMHIDGFPPLYVGAGVDLSWGKAKGGHAEIHPLLMERIQTETVNMPIRRTEESEADTKEVVKQFDTMNYDFRIEKVKKYILDDKNWYQDVHPSVAKLLAEEFNNGKKGSDEEHKDMSTAEFTVELVGDFISRFGLDVDHSVFKATDNKIEAEEDNEYEDDEDVISDYAEDYERTFKVVDESDVFYGADIKDIIAQFGICVIKHKKLCGIDVRHINYHRLGRVCDYLASKQCQEEEEGSMRVVFLKAGNLIEKTPVYVKDIDEDSLDAWINSEGAESIGDIENRAVR